MADDKKFSVNEASIRTASVEIRMIYLSNRNLTKAVFAQIEVEGLLDVHGERLGEPWGRINYHPGRDKCDEREHVHVLWQKGDQLRRARIHEPGRFGAFDRASSRRYWVAAQARRWLEAALGEDRIDEDQIRVHGMDHAWIDVDGRLWLVELSDGVKDVLNAKNPRQRADAVERLSRRVKVSFDDAHVQLEQEYQQQHDVWSETGRQYSYFRSDSVPQLFLGG